MLFRSVLGFGSAIYPGNIAESLTATPSQPTIQNFWTGRLGFDILSYNLGDGQSSILSDTWLDANITAGTDGSVSGGVSLSTRL